MSTEEKQPSNETDSHMPLDYDEHSTTFTLVADDDEQTAKPDLPVVAAAPRRRLRGLFLTKVIVFGLLPALALLLAVGNGYLKWRTESVEQSQVAAAQSVAAATETTIALLSYQPTTAQEELTAAADRLTGGFRDEYLTLINDVVIPGSKAKNIGATVTIPAAASISATESRAQVLVYVNQATTIGNETPSNSVSSVKLTLDKEDDRWLVSQFEPV